MHKKLYSKYYFINNFDSNLINKQDKLTTIIYRNYNEVNNKIETILKIKNFCKKKNIKFFVANNIKLAIKLKLDGAYIPSFNKDLSHLSYKYPKNFTIIGSAHNLREIKIKEKQGVKLIVISSLFKKKNFLKIYKFRLLTKLTKKKIIALGGISQKNLKLLNLSGCIGFAGITYFEQKKGPY